MAGVRLALEALQKAASERQFHGNKQIHDSIGHISSSLILLELSSPPNESMKRLTALLREPLIPLYITFPDLALRFCVAMFYAILEEKITTAAEAGEEEVRRSWEGVQGSLLSGVLDFIETNHTNENKAAVATALYSTLCDIYFPPFNTSAINQTSASLISTVYMLLSETVTLQPQNQHKLRDPRILGGKRIGIILSQSKDFLAIESLLDLFASLLPSTNRTVAGREKRTRFIQEVFDPQLFTCDQELVQILESVSTNDWEATSLKLFDVLASSSIDFPQPFQLNEIRACDTTFLQPNLADRLYVDNRSFFANVDEEGAYETFQAPYSLVRGMKFSAPSTFQTSVTVYLSSPPVVGESPINPPRKGEKITIVFDLKNEDVGRFVKSLQSRGLSKYISQAERRLSLADSPLRLEFDAKGRKLPDLSAEEKIKTMNSIFEPPGSDSIFSSDYPGQKIESTSPLVLPRPPCLPNPVSGLFETAPPEPAHTSKHSDSITIATASSTVFPVDVPDTVGPVPSLNTKLRRDAVFGTSDEELSEMSEDDSTNVSRPARSKLSSRNKPIQVPEMSVDNNTSCAPIRAKVRRVLDSEDESNMAVAQEPKVTRQGAKKKRAVDPADETEELEVKPTKGAVTDNHSVKAIADRPKPTAGKKLATSDAVSHIKIVPIKDVDVLGNPGNQKKLNPPVALSTVDISDHTSVPRSKQSRGEPAPIDINYHISGRNNSGGKLNCVGTYSATLLDASERNLNHGSNPPTVSNNAATGRSLGDTGAGAAGLNSSTKQFTSAKESKSGTRTTAEASQAPGNQEKPDLSKRKRGTIEEVNRPHSSDDCNDEADRRPIKRLRGSSSKLDVKTVPAARGPSAVVDPRNTRNTKATKRYGRKGRTSSPTPSSALDVNYDELPTPLSLPEEPKKPAELRKSRISAMKGKNGKDVKTEPVSAKPKAARGVAGLDSVKGTLKKSKKAPPQDVRAYVKAEESKISSKKPNEDPAKMAKEQDRPKSNDSKPVRRSARVANNGVVMKEVVPSSVPDPDVENVSRITRKKPKKAPWEEPNFIKTSDVTSYPVADSVEIVQDTAMDDDSFSDLAATWNDERPTTSNVDHDIFNPIDSFVPIKASPSNSHDSVIMPEKDVVMIDLTQEELPVIYRVPVAPPKEATPILVVEPPTESPIRLQRLNKLPTPPPPPPKPDRGRYTVTFASPKKSPTPDAHREVSPAKNRPVLLKTEGMTVPPGPKYRDPRGKHNFTNDLDFEDESGRYGETDTWMQDGGESPVQGIVDILNEIQEVIIHKISRRFDDVKNDVRSGRDYILYKAAVDLQNMRAGGVVRFNALVDLEEEYAAYRRKLVDGFEDMQKINQEISQHLRQIIQDHDRHTLSKKFPNTLTSPLPSILLNPTTVLSR